MRPVALAASAAALLVLGACGPTTYDATVTTEVAVATTTTLPTGTAAELMPRLVDEAAALSQLISTKGDDLAAAQRIAALWDAVSQEVAKTRPELLGDFEANVARCRKAADRNRPADADKAYLNLEALVGAYLS